VTTYVIRRVLQAIPTIVVASILVWAMVYALPGDPVIALLGEDPNPQAVAFERERLGLDKPIYIQYLTWAGNVLQGDLGYSYFGGEAVGDRISRRVMPTVQLGGFAFIVAVILALPIASFGSLRPNSLSGKVVSAQSVLSLSLPTFWVGILFILFFAVRWRIFPAVSDFHPFWESPALAFRNTFLPGLTLGIFVSAIFGRFLRQALTEVLGKDYVRTARSKGLKESIVVGRHALRNALLPFVTIAGLQVSSFISGSVVTESVFSYPGIGRLIYTAILQRDYALIQGTTLLIVVAVTVINLVVDIIYAYLDPRISYA
jgi:peptide/nickel transport system permease protein